MKKKWKSVSKDFIYNILASFALTGVLQIAVYPFLAYRFDAQEYGTLLTIMGIANTIAMALGNTLNNVRLIMNTKYDEKKLQGDFNFLLIIAIVLALVIAEIVAGVFVRLSPENLIGIGLYIIFLILRSYYCVQFRIVLNFKNMLFAFLISAMGYLFGLLLTYKTAIWTVPFVMGELFFCIYVVLYTDLYKEKYILTELFPETIKKYLILIVSGLVGNLLTYLDRLLIYPLLGGDAVTTYTVASMFGKSLGLVMTPIAGVLLGYYAQKDFVMNRRLFWGINGITFGISFLFILFAIPVSPFVLQILYPTVYEMALPYVFLANLAATINIMCSLTQSAILKFAPTWVQLIKDVVYVVSYIAGSLFLLGRFGLWGFCIAAIIANLLRLFTLCFIGNIYIK